jgi:hypothetical protein
VIAVAALIVAETAVVRLVAPVEDRVMLPEYVPTVSAGFGLTYTEVVATVSLVGLRVILVGFVVESVQFD